MYEEEKRLIEFRDRFSDLLEKYLDAIYDERKFRGLLSDYFPAENWLSHLLMALYKARIVEEIEDSESMDFESFLRFKKKLVNNYRTQEQDAEWAIGMWFECYGNHILKKTNNVERYIYRNVAINSKESIELIEEIIEISKGKSCGEKPLKYLCEIFEKSSRYPNALKKLYLLHPILEQYDTDEKKYSEWMYASIYGKESICEYDDYMDLYNALLDLKYNVDYYLYGALLLNGECADQEVFNVKLNKENAYKWCAYYYEEIKKRKIKNITSTIFSIANLEFALGAAYLQGKYIERDVKKATYCWKSMLKRDIEEYSNIEDMGIMLKCIGAAYIGEEVTVTVQGDEYEIKLRKNLKLGYEFLKKSADNRNVASIFLLAGMYEKGEYVEKDFFYAVQLYKKAKEGGDEEASEWIEKNKIIVELLNEIIEISKSTEYDDKLGSRIYEVFIKAPQFPEVLRCLHLLYPVIKNYDTEEYSYSRNIFVRLFIKTTVCGYEDYFVLFNKLADLRWDGDYYLYGILVGGSIIEWDEKTLELTYSLENSIKWFAYFYELIKRKNISYVRFSNAGEEIVEFELGCAYAHGLYLEKNTKKGYQYWKEILRKENNELGDLRRTGEILSMIGGMYLGRTCKIRIPDDKIYYIKIRKNGKESFKYLLRASELGNIQASLLLAEMYEKGNYVERDIKKAYKLYQKAAKEDNEDAKEWIRKYEQKKYSDLKFEVEEFVDIDEDEALDDENEMILMDEELYDEDDEDFGELSEDLEDELVDADRDKANRNISENEEDKIQADLLNEVIEITHSTKFNDELWCRIYKIFMKAPQFPKVLKQLYLLYPVVKKYDTKEKSYSRNIFAFLFKKDSVCNYEEYFFLFNKLADLGWDGDYYLYGIFSMGRKLELDGCMLELEYNMTSAIKWITYFYDLIKAKNISYTRLFSNEEGEIEFYLGCVYSHGIYVEKNIKNSYKYWEQMLEKSDEEWEDLKEGGRILMDVGAMYLGKTCNVKLMDNKFYDITIEKREEKSLEYLIKAIQFGNAEAILLLAEMYEKGEYVGKDIQHAYELYQRAAEKGSKEAEERIMRYGQKS